jgi:hypothetical protein
MDDDDDMDFGPAKTINDMNLTTEELVNIIEIAATEIGEEVVPLPPAYIRPEKSEEELTKEAQTEQQTQNDRLRAWMEEVRQKRAGVANH